MTGPGYSLMNKGADRIATYQGAARKAGSLAVRRRGFLSCLLAAVVPAFSSSRPEGSRNNSLGMSDHPAAKELAARVIGARAESLDFESIEAAGGADVFEIETHGERLIVRGNTPITQAHGLNHYLREFCNGPDFLDQR